MGVNTHLYIHTQLKSAPRIDLRRKDKQIRMQRCAHSRRNDFPTRWKDVMRFCSDNKHGKLKSKNKKKPSSFSQTLSMSQARDRQDVVVIKKKTVVTHIYIPVGFESVWSKSFIILTQTFKSTLVRKCRILHWWQKLVAGGKRDKTIRIWVDYKWKAIIHFVINNVNIHSVITK